MNQWGNTHSGQLNGLIGCLRHPVGDLPSVGAPYGALALRRGSCSGQCPLTTISRRYVHGRSSSLAVRKTFKKLYQQKDLVRNTKDQYGAVCDSIWKQSHQRLTLKGSWIPSVSGQVAQLPSSSCVDFFDINCSKKQGNSSHRYSIEHTSKTSYQKTWIPEINGALRIPAGEQSSLTNQTPGRGEMSHKGHQGTLPNIFIKNIEIKSSRINTAKLLRRDDTSNLSEGRSVVNTALENYSKRMKIKTLAEMHPSRDTV